MQEKKLKHLEFIQQAVNRMASNLFLLKGWTVTLIAALFALAAKDSKDVYFLIAYCPPPVLGARRLLLVARATVPSPLRPRA